MSRRLFWLAGFLAGGLLFIYISAGSVVATVPGDRWFCSRCHQMTAIVAAWQHSPHRDVACAFCHAPAGWLGYLGTTLQSAHIVLDTLDGFWKRQVPIHATVHDSSCLSCHRAPIRNAQGAVTVPGWRQPVRRHGKTLTMWQTYAAGYHCTQCHSTLVEGRLVSAVARTRPHLPSGLILPQAAVKAKAWLAYLTRQEVRKR